MTDIDETKNNPYAVIQKFHQYHDWLTPEERRTLISSMWSTPQKVNMLINGCFPYLTAPECCAILWHIMDRYDDDALYQVKMPITVYIEFMGKVFHSKRNGHKFILKLTNADLVDRFIIKWRRYLQEDEDVNYNIRRAVAKVMNSFKSRELKSLLILLPKPIEDVNADFEDWNNI